MSAAVTAQPIKLIRLPEVVALTGMGKSSVWARAKAGTFPRPVKLGPRTTAWVAAEVEQWAADALARRPQQAQSGGSYGGNNPTAG